jgi:hypothetical protein
MKNRTIVLLLITGLVFLVLPEHALAGPGGMIAKAAAKTLWGKIAIGALIIIFLPLIMYITIKERISERRARRDLRFMAAYDPRFDWLTLRERVRDCFHRVHSAWRKEDVSEASEWMTDWYWQNQQMVFLDRWEREGLTNHCEVKRVKSIRPLLFVHRNDAGPHEGSLVAVSITATMQDYLARRDSGEVVEGDTKWKEVETIWSFRWDDGCWRVSTIEDGSCSLEYAKMVKELPPIQETLVNG